MENKKMFSLASSQGRICSIVVFVFWSLASLAQNSNSQELVEKANQGDSQAQFEIGTELRNKKDYMKAFEWYSKAAAQGYAKAEYNVGYCYENGIGVEKNVVKAFEWYSKAAAQGFAMAEHAVGYCYENGIGVEKNVVKAFEWYSKAAAQGFAMAEYAVGYRYGNGIGVEKNVTKAFEWLSKSAAQGYADAECYVGYCYNYGIGVEENVTKAFEWYSKAASQGNVIAEHNVANCYKHGIGVAKDNQKGWIWMVKAANNGYLDAQISCMNDYEKAGSEWVGMTVKYALLASQQGSEEAKEVFRKIAGLPYANLDRTYKSKIKMYTGEYPIKFQGSKFSCSYQYYEIGDIRIYHGIFEAKSNAVVRTKEGKDIPVLTIKGQFKDGYRDGVWNIQHQYDSIKITYRDGNIDGLLEELSPTEKMNAEYKNNTLIKFLWNNNKGESVEAHMDDEGYMHGAYLSKRKNGYDGEVIRKGNFIHGISEDFSELYVQTGDIRRGIISKTSVRKVMGMYNSEAINFVHNDFTRGLETSWYGSYLSTVRPQFSGALKYK